MFKKTAVFSSFVAMLYFASPVIADEYQEAYNCATEALQDGFGPASSCVGNSRDPSSVEEKAYADAQKDFAAGREQAAQCLFEFGIWMASGSRADGFEEGAQLISTLSEAANLLGSGRSIYLYDANGNKVPNEVAYRWFSQQGDSVTLTQEAIRQCAQKK